MTGLLFGDDGGEGAVDLAGGLEFEDLVDVGAGGFGHGDAGGIGQRGGGGDLLMRSTVFGFSRVGRGGGCRFG